ncbi:radical SAM family heme chaperone HemW [Selenomonas noxia]|uniref:radical SAM family heme chaperone HemW n=1 Tax=Selenomonas noxia TaxID=135083 RepID=UPI00248B367A|nr:radical SAM family heme chaperone HemW [Selenomonas noxia]
MTSKAWGIYAHIPYCVKKCAYCDFISAAVGTNEAEMEDYAAALRAEILREAPPLRARFGDAATIYIGGGTPTVLPAALLAGIIETIREAAGTPAECTVEANPGTVDEDDLTQLRAAGADRLSLGVQSFDDRLLRVIGRIHTAAEARAAFHAARAAGFRNISIDLMYGLPTQTLADLKHSVAAALALAPEHISVYGLIVEEGTPFAAAEAAGRLALPSEDAAEEMYDFLTEELPARGYRRYEISNFARAGFESRHNLGYWQNVPYLGVGAAAHGYVDGVRWGNETDTRAYIRGVRAGENVRIPEDGERTETTAMEEYAFLALRTAEGIDEADFRRTFGIGLDEVYGGVVRRYTERGMLRRAAGYTALTAAGMKRGNEVFAAFLRDA